MNSYLEMKNRHQEEVNSFPMHAFGDEQIKRKIAELNLDPLRLSEQIVSIGCGGFVLKEDAPALKEMWKRHAEERRAAIAADTTGDGYIYDMFLYELQNHEYGYTFSTEDPIEALGYSEEESESTPALKNGLEKAAKKIREREGCEW